MWNYIKKWWMLKHIRYISKQAIIACGFGIRKDTMWCTTCHEKIYVICESHVSYTGETFTTSKTIACCCLRCRWFEMGKPEKGPDEGRPPLERFLLENKLPVDMHRKFNPNPYFAPQLLGPYR